MVMEAFKRAAAKNDGSSGFDFIEAILRERPDLRGQVAYTPRYGNLAHTVIIGDEVFKGPRAEDLFNSFDEEPGFLNGLEGKGLPVPRVTCIGKETVFFGMTRMPGVPIWDVEAMLTAEHWELLAKDITDFIVSVALGMPQREGKYARHGDLNLGNVLVDPETKKLTAIVDFGSVCYHPKKKLGDFNFVRYNHKLYKMIQREYKSRKNEIPKPVGPSRLRRFFIKKTKIPAHGIKCGPAKRSLTLDLQRRAPW